MSTPSTMAYECVNRRGEQFTLDLTIDEVNEWCRTGRAQDSTWWKIRVKSSNPAMNAYPWVHFDNNMEVKTANG